jgi:hypothetical protein
VPGDPVPIRRAAAAAHFRRERIDTAQRLRDRLSADEIAELLGIHERTVRSYWYATRCACCGGPQIVRSAASCADCSPYVAQRRPSKTAIVRALRRWNRETDEPPGVCRQARASADEFRLAWRASSSGRLGDHPPPRHVARRTWEGL